MSDYRKQYGDYLVFVTDDDIKPFEPVPKGCVSHPRIWRADDYKGGVEWLKKSYEKIKAHLSKEGLTLEKPRWVFRDRDSSQCQVDVPFIHYCETVGWKAYATEVQE